MGLFFSLTEAFGKLDKKNDFGSPLTPSCDAEKRGFQAIYSKRAKDDEHQINTFDRHPGELGQAGEVPNRHERKTHLRKRRRREYKLPS